MNAAGFENHMVSLLTWEQPHASLLAQMVKNLPVVQKSGFYPWVRNIPWSRE